MDTDPQDKRIAKIIGIVTLIIVVLVFVFTRRGSGWHA